MGKTVADLKDELRKRKLPTDGLKADLVARLDAADQQVAEEAVQGFKKCKTVMNSIADEYLCPITQELPIDPATAEDGKIYERSAIQTWLEKNERSPSTGEPMGKRLLPAVQARSTIEQLVKSGEVDAEKAAAWTKKLEEETRAKEWKSKAESGDAEAMLALSCMYKSGDFGLAKDDKQARAWAERAAELGHVKSMVTLGLYLCDGTGGKKNEPLGLYYMTKAAMLGSDHAAWNMGVCLQSGLHGLPRNVKQAKFWYTQIVDRKCKVIHARSGSAQLIKEAKEALLELD